MRGRFFEGIEHNIEPTERVVAVTLKGLDVDRPNVLMNFVDLKAAVERVILETSKCYNFDSIVVKLLLESDDLYIIELLDNNKIIIDINGAVTYKSICLSTLEYYKNHFINLGIYDSVRKSFSDFCNTIIINLIK